MIPDSSARPEVLLDMLTLHQDSHGYLPRVTDQTVDRVLNRLTVLKQQVSAEQVGGLSRSFVLV